MSWAAGLNVFEKDLTLLARERLQAIAAADVVVEAVRAQNRVTASYDQARIGELDAVWRDEVASGSRALIGEVLDRPVSRYLAQMQEASEGLFTEIILMDGRGLNVGISQATSDYWQGDEDKWQKIVPVGPQALHIGPLEEDLSTRTVQSQVSLPVVDPQTGAVIGALAIGVDVEEI
ncbi:hypothetical protein [Stappia sp.]|uniref:hypothetical protein n=1 Tax=Stappia sp. TaxID=1870903 RepID=UPI003A9A5FF2